MFRDEEGNWILGFSCCIGITSSYMAELWAVRDGLSICVDRNFHAVIIEMDALAIIEAITNPSQPNAVLSAIRTADN